ncbi:MAG: type II toxin-antitoxin system PemK/MazF family toxin [Candidatus Eremiobacteraeota bacterium]|nr:type II toxin-antitoxin system PemK/MazF family toxin [Candidatus Eremiobacteraeota bacterium]MBV8355064.1 type II toxin-antitoxin system PemK/MazF family toxin [Candidatus Eremiobacteraeota bacterium]
MPRCPEAGDIGYIDFDPQAGREQARRRPALVLTPRDYNSRVGLVIAAPITSRVKGYPFEVELDAGCPLEGVVLADQLKSLDWRVRRFEFVFSAGSRLMRRTRALIGELLSI